MGVNPPPLAGLCPWLWLYLSVRCGANTGAHTGATVVRKGKGERFFVPWHFLTFFDIHQVYLIVGVACSVHFNGSSPLSICAGHRFCTFNPKCRRRNTMSMFCYQCQETAKGTGCTIKGVCGKEESTAGLQDLLVFILKGLAVADREVRKQGKDNADTGMFVAQAMFATITNANFDNARITALIKEALQRREALKQKVGMSAGPDCVTWSGSEADFAAKAKEVGVLSQPNEDVRSLRELLIYGVKGMCAYTDHAAVLGYEKDDL